MTTAPVFLLEGLTGSFIRPPALSYTLATLTSLLVALTVTPALALMLLRGSAQEHRDSPVVRVLRRGMCHCCAASSGDRAGRTPGALVTLIAGIAVLPLVGQSLLPSFKERDS